MNKKKKISIIIPVYNEFRYIKSCIENILEQKFDYFDFEIIVSDNNSNDGTKEILKKIENEKIKIFFQEHNYGKGSNIKNALKYISGDYILIQDADLEYSPLDYNDLFSAVYKQKADVVFGTRFARAKYFHVFTFIHLLANKIITLLTNVLYNKSFSDVLTGYKLIRADIITQLNLQSNNFDVDTEITCKISKLKNIRIFEVPISINSRTYDEGKKIHWWHLFLLIFSIVKWRILKNK
jgi:glycosyltransferase involved in cell wall biosynthesis